MIILCLSINDFDNKINGIIIVIIYWKQSFHQINKATEKIYQCLNQYSVFVRKKLILDVVSILEDPTILESCSYTHLIITSLYIFLPSYIIYQLIWLKWSLKVSITHCDLSFDIIKWISQFIHYKNNIIGFVKRFFCIETNINIEKIEFPFYHLINIYKLSALFIMFFFKKIVIEMMLFTTINWYVIIINFSNNCRMLI